jgi:type II secretory pathway pseudopilin PulG
MKTGLKTRGYTIIEVMIVFAVTGAILLVAMMAVSGQQAKAEFTQSINDIQAQINDVINNVATGYYSSAGSFKCVASASSPTVPEITGDASSQGTNQDCTFIGRAIQFAVNGNPNAYNIYNIVGLRLKDGINSPKTLSEAKPTAVAPGATTHTSVPSVIESSTLQGGLKAVTMKYNDGSDHPINAIGFMSSLAQTSSQKVNLVPIFEGSLGQDSGTVVDAIDALDDSRVNPSGGVTICFQSGGTNQNGVITIGSKGRQLNTQLAINSGACL